MTQGIGQSVDCKGLGTANLFLGSYGSQIEVCGDLYSAQSQQVDESLLLSDGEVTSRYLKIDAKLHVRSQDSNIVHAIACQSVSHSAFTEIMSCIIGPQTFFLA